MKDSADEKCENEEAVKKMPKKERPKLATSPRPPISDVAQFLYLFDATARPFNCKKRMVAQWHCLSPQQGDS